MDLQNQKNNQNSQEDINPLNIPKKEDVQKYAQIDLAVPTPPQKPIKEEALPQKPEKEILPEDKKKEIPKSTSKKSHKGEEHSDSQVTRTLLRDLADTMKENKDGFVKKVIQEQEEKEIEKHKQEVYSKRNKIYITLSIIFVLITGAFVFFVFFQDQVNSFFVKRRFSLHQVQ